MEKTKVSLRVLHLVPVCHWLKRIDPAGLQAKLAHAISEAGEKREVILQFSEEEINQLKETCDQISQAMAMVWQHLNDRTAAHQAPSPLSS